jgi:hypothetical protein
MSATAQQITQKLASIQKILAESEERTRLQQIEFEKEMTLLKIKHKRNYAKMWMTMAKLMFLFPVIAFAQFIMANFTSGKWNPAVSFMSTNFLLVSLYVSVRMFFYFRHESREAEDAALVLYIGGTE